MQATQWGSYWDLASQKTMGVGPYIRVNQVA